MLTAPPNTAPKTPKPAAAPGFSNIQRFWDSHTGHWTARILPGEFYVTRSDEGVSTVLGSCISACIRDRVNGVGGMNHFMLPEDNSVGKDSWSMADGTPSTRYGTNAMESLINEALKLGARRDRLELKLFGGGRILPSMTDIGARNIAFARNFVRIEGIPVAAEDLGDTVPRHVVYFPATGRVRLKRLRALETQVIAAGEFTYRDRLAAQPAESDVELFD
ncbi:MAG: chemoreceptor glutamine deamidase CheD [Gammaproteobacteria bacterium]|nr:chemoreceptor glutamine deamidase CheD [Gammaproteobacteria bacterium]MDE2349418.1 chemoreceptor glutamine deamidase CheD [Gammaproteobacteria bacterium]